MSIAALTLSHGRTTAALIALAAVGCTIRVELVSLPSGRAKRAFEVFTAPQTIEMTFPTSGAATSTLKVRFDKDPFVPPAEGVAPAVDCELSSPDSQVYLEFELAADSEQEVRFQNIFMDNAVTLDPGEKAHLTVQLSDSSVVSAVLRTDFGKYKCWEHVAAGGSQNLRVAKLVTGESSYQLAVHDLYRCVTFEVEAEY